MDNTELIAAGSAAFGFGVGYLLAYWLSRRDLITEIGMRIDAIRHVAQPIADMRQGQVPWSAIDKLLRKFPGQQSPPPFRRTESERKWDQ